MTTADLITILRQEIKGLSSNFVSDDYTNAINNAMRDTGWSMPVSTDFKIQWMKQRATRHLFFFLLTESAHKFKYKQINLQHRFDHYKTLVKDMDASFEKAQEEYVHEFADASAYEMFGTVIDAGFAGEPQTGRDITYDEDQKVIVTPNENS